jgi:RND family efflux transporter MFP subunit
MVVDRRTHTEAPVIASHRSYSKIFRALTFCLLAAASLALAGCKSGYPVAARQNKPTEGATGREVKTARVEQQVMERAIMATGTLAAYDQATISAKIPGRLRSITVDLGSIVRQGQVVANIEPQDYQLRLQQAEAALAQARARLGLSPEGTDDRVKMEETAPIRQARAVLDEALLKRDRAEALLKQGVIARAQMDTAEAEYKVALSRYQDAEEEVRNRQALLLQRRSELELARKQLSDTGIRASFDGVVEEKQASLGEYIAAGAPVVTIVRMNPLRLRAEVPERDSRSVRSGQLVRVTVEGDSSVYTGRITRLSPTIGADNRMLVVEAEVANDGQLRPGSFARVEIVTDDKSMSVIAPSSAIVSFAGIEKVIIVEDGKAVEKPVTIGRRRTDVVEILSGVNVGEAVVLEPGNLQTGQPVSVVQ